MRDDPSHLNNIMKIHNFFTKKRIKPKPKHAAMVDEEPSKSVYYYYYCYYCYYYYFIACVKLVAPPTITELIITN